MMNSQLFVQQFVFHKESQIKVHSCNYVGLTLLEHCPEEGSIQRDLGGNKQGYHRRGSNTKPDGRKEGEGGVGGHHEGPE
jgi:hypothetical protein